MTDSTDRTPAVDRAAFYCSTHPPGGGEPRLVVTTTEFGPTERIGAIELRELTHHWGVNWGYTGSGASRAAEVILTDALGHAPPRALQEAFLDEVISQLTEDFRLRRGMVLRWIRGWCTTTGAAIPNGAVAVPPVDTDDYEPRPESVKQQSHRQIFGPAS